MKSITALLLAFIVILSSGCASRIPFTHELRSEYQLTTDDVKSLHYYVSDLLAMRRDVRKGEGGVSTEHAFRVVKDKLIEEIRLKPGTPGIAEEVGADFVRVSFEEGNSLTFTCRDKEKGATGGRYYLDVKEWRGTTAVVEYEGKEFRAATGGLAHLVVDFDQIQKLKKEIRTVKGRRLPEK